MAGSIRAWRLPITNALFTGLAEAQPNPAIGLPQKSAQGTRAVRAQSDRKGLRRHRRLLCPSSASGSRDTQAIAARATGEAKTRADQDAKFIADALAAAERSSEKSFPQTPGYNLSVASASYRSST